MVFDCAADREMVEVLVFAVLEAKYFVHRIVEVATDAGAADACRFSFQIKHLADDSGFPKETRIKPRAVALHRFLKFSNHAKAETTIAGDCLGTGNLSGGLACFGLDKAIKFELLWASWWPTPLVSLSERCFQRFSLCGVAHQEVKSRRQIIDAVNKNGQVKARFPGKRAEGKRTGDCQSSL